MKDRRHKRKHKKHDEARSQGEQEDQGSVSAAQ